MRVFVKPEEMTDFAARELARNIALRIENDLKYPGEIKVTVIRETRSIEFADKSSKTGEFLKLLSNFSIPVALLRRFFEKPILVGTGRFAIIH